MKRAFESPAAPIWLFAATLLITTASTPLAQPTVDFLITNKFAEPHSIAVDENNRFFLTDSAEHRVFRYDTDNGTLTSIAGVRGQPGADNGPGFVARFFSPRGVVLARGGLIVADAGNHTLRYLTLTGSVSIVTNFVGATGIPGFADGPASLARFNSPVGLAADSAGNIFVADSKNNAIRKIDLNNIVTTLATHFFEPSAIAVGDNGALFVADTRNHSIKLVAADGTVRLLAGQGSNGTNDSFFAEEAQFNAPSGLIWLGTNTGLIVSDSGNHTLRRVFFDPIIATFFPDKTGFSVETYAGVPRRAGFEDGPLQLAQFNAPVGLARDIEGGLLVADLGNRALRRIQTTPRRPRIGNPRIGYVTFVIDDFSGQEVSKLVPVTDAVFNNDLTLAIAAEAQTETFFTAGPTPGLFDADPIPVPTSANSQPAPPYSDGMLRSQVRPSFLDPRPDVTVKAISTAEGRRPSDVVQARIQFKVATPVILGDNPGSFGLTNETSEAEMWYTLDGSTPTNQPPSLPAPNDTISLRITNAVTFKARGFRRNFKPSEIVTKTFYPVDFRANRISFGFGVGDVSSQFLGSPGQRFIAPVTMSLLQGQKIYAMQFNITATNGPGAPPLQPSFGFQSMLLKMLDDGTFRTIEPLMFTNYFTETVTNGLPNGSILISTNRIPLYTNALFINPSKNLMGVGWFELVGLTNLYNTRLQHLLTFSQAQSKRFFGVEGKAVLGAYSFSIPTQAQTGFYYRIQLDRPSAIESGAPRDAFIDAPTDGPLGGGGLNSIKHITLTTGGLGAGELHYIVGDVSPFRWYNTADFGDTNILNNDVYELFQAANYQTNLPPTGSDYFDAMDSCCRTASGVSAANLFDGSDDRIDQILFGDGDLNVSDVFVIFRRSLDPTLKWFARYWNNGQRQAAEVPNRFRGKLDQINQNELGLRNRPAESLTATSPLEPPSVLFKVDDVIFTAGSTVRVPIRAEIQGPVPVRVLMLNLSVEPIDGAAPITEPIRVIPAPELGLPTFTGSAGPANYSAAWLNHTIAGLKGATEVATVILTTPAASSRNAAYRVRFDHASASPNGLALFPEQHIPGLLATRPHADATLGDNIPDHWRLRYFGSLFNELAHANADADGDKVSNWAEFQAGTDPTDIRSQLRLQTSGDIERQVITLRWPSIRSKQYLIEACPGLEGVWVPLGPALSGTGADLQFDVTNFVSSAQFFRVRLVE